MIRIFGGLFITGATTLLGITKANEVKEQYGQMQYLQRLIFMTKSEIQYARAYLGEIFDQIGRKAYEPYKSWLFDLSRKMEAREEGTFGDMWEKSIDKHLRQCGLPAKELERLKGLGAQLGFADMEVQIRLLDLYLEQLAQTMSEVREEMKVKVRLCHCLGVMSGILITVLLI